MRLAHFAALALGLFTVAAHADTFLYTLTETESQYPNFDYVLTTTTPIPTITGPTTLNSSEFKIVGGVVFPSSIVLDGTIPYGPSGAIIFEDSNGNYIEAPLATYTLAQYTTAGTYFNNFTNTNYSGNDETDTLVVTDIPSVTPTAVTPEPSSLILLGTGLLGFAGMARKRFATSY